MNELPESEDDLLAHARKADEFDAERPRKGPFQPSAHRMLPASSDAEAGLLGSALVAPRDVLPLAKSAGVTSAWFHVPSHAIIWDALAAMDDAATAIDIITLTDRLEKNGTLELAGGRPAIAELFSRMPTAQNAAYYLDIGADKHLLREGIRVFSESAGRCYDAEKSAHEILADAHEAVTALVLRGSRRGECKPIKRLAFEAVDRMQERCDGKARYIKTGIPRLDDESPMRPGDFVVIAGRRKSGKSALVADIVRNVAVVEGEPCAVFSLEMNDWQYVERLIANMGRISLRSINKGKLSEEETKSLAPTVELLSGAPLFIHDSVYQLSGIVARARQLKAQHPEMTLAVVDYCQLVEVPERKGSNREQEVSKVSRALKLLASELGIVIIGLSQLNADGETRESRALEQDCTALWKVLEELDKNGQVPKGKENLRTIYVPFQRNGPPNIRMRMLFHGYHSRFEEDHSEQEESDETTERKSSPPHKRPQSARDSARYQD